MSKLTETTNLVTGVVGDTKDLFELQLKLVRAEIRELSTLGKQVLVLGAFSLAAFVPALLFFGLFLSEALVSATHLSTWACHLIVCVGFLMAGALPMLRVKKLIEERKSDS